MERMRHVKGYGPSDGRCFPCSGVSGRAVNASPCSSRSDSKNFKQVKVASLRCASRFTLICNANSGSYRRNPDFSRQNKHGFSRSRNRQNEERDGSDNLEESEIFSSKNGPLLSVSTTPKFQATATPGPREKEIVELFKKVQAQLRERAAMKEEKKIEDVQGQSKQSETVDSLLKLLRKHSVQQGKRSSSSGSSKDFILNQPEQSGTFSEEKGTTFFSSDNRVKDKVAEAPSASRPVSNFRRRSPVPQVKYQPVYNDEDTLNSVSHTNRDVRRKEKSPQPLPMHEPTFKDETVLEPEPDSIFSDTDVFDGMSDDETSDRDEIGDDDDARDESLAPHRDLSGMKLPELRALAKSRGMKGFSKLKKLELVELLAGGSM
ncbi:hypothetical protein RJ639_039010 [Escallonia herrerae]|uniref:Rho termination factor-like N-terminal domain-containing protein n=1 Tax=Escallonia herrerae TaxID=1293975 RepID=A0AA88WJU9_9ASTE|nr:hypothetical protein RJ639_039010 [Escallonia herrerae]